MSQTDPRAVAVMVPITTHGCECRREICATHAAIARALADAERRVLERAAKVVEGERYLGLPNIDATKRTVTVNYVHQWMQSKLTRIAQAIRAQAQADQEG